MARQERVIASGGTPVPGVPFTSSRATGRQVASILRRGGVPVRTVSDRPPAPFPARPRPVVQQQQPQQREAPFTSVQGTGAEIASMLRLAGIPVKTTSTKEPPPFPQFPRPDAPPREPQVFEPATISETLTGAEIASILRRGGVPVRTVSQATQEPAVDPASMADPRAELFSPEPDVTAEPITQVERLTAQQLKDMGVPVQTISDTQESSGPVTPSVEETKQTPPTVMLTTGTPVAGVPWSTQSNIPVDLQSSLDPYAPSFTGPDIPFEERIPAHEAPPIVGTLEPSFKSEARSVQDFQPDAPVTNEMLTAGELPDEIRRLLRSTLPPG